MGMTGITGGQPALPSLIPRRSVIGEKSTWYQDQDSSLKPLHWGTAGTILVRYILCIIHRDTDKYSVKYTTTPCPASYEAMVSKSALCNVWHTHALAQAHPPMSCVPLVMSLHVPSH